MVYRFAGTWVWHHKHKWTWLGYTWRRGHRQVRIGPLIIRFVVRHMEGIPRIEWAKCKR